MLVFSDSLLLPQPSLPMVDATAKLAGAGAGAELRLLSGVLCDRRAKIFLYGFLFAFVACTAYLAFNPDTPAAASPFFARFFAPYAPSSAVSDAADSPPLLQLPSVSPSPVPPLVVPPAPSVVGSGARVSNFSAKLMSMNVTKPAASPRGSPDRNETAAVVGRREVKNATAKAGVSQTSFNQSRQGSDGDGVNATDSGRRERGVSLETMKRCDLYDGRWVKDESYPLYEEGSCPLIDEQYDCFQNGRRDKNYLKYRWQPNGCNIPRLNATDMLERLRGRRMVLVGDSLNRNMWESLVCILRNSVKDKKKVFEVSGRQQFRSQGAYSFIFQDYNCSVEFFWSPFLVQEWATVDKNGSTKETLRLDLFERKSEKFRKADVVVFNTGHWWTHEKTSLGKDYYQEGNHVYSQLNVVEAFRKAMVTWARWVDINVDPRKTVVFFRGYSASHFSGGQWNSGGACDNETEPINNDVYLTPYPEKMKVLETVLNETKKTRISYMNITRLTDYRKDGHPSVYRKRKYSAEEKKSPLLYQDCSHWCLPGVPDSWNELLYAELLIKLN